MKYKTQSEIEKAIKEYIARGVREEALRDGAPFESVEYWKHHDRAVNWFLKAEALMPGGIRPVPSRQSERKGLRRKSNVRKARKPKKAGLRLRRLNK